MPASPRLPLRTFVLATVLALIAAVATYVVLSDDDGDDRTAAPGTMDLSPEVSVDPDEVSFTTFDDEVVTLRSLRGQPVLVNFFASWCTPCIKEMPALEAAHQVVGDQVQFLGLAMNDRKADALDLVERTGITYRVGQDPDSSVWTTFKGINLPTTVLLDADGEVVATHAGELTEAEVLALIDESLDVRP